MVNNTHWAFNATGDYEVDLIMIPRMTSLYYKQFLDLQSQGIKNTTTMFKLGQQLGLGQKLFATRALPVNSNHTILYIGLGVLFVAFIGLAVWFMKKPKR